MMKNSLPDGWTKTTLGSFMDFKNGVNAGKEAYGKGVKFVNVLDIFHKNCLFSHDIEGSVEISDKELEMYSVVKGDILFNRTSETREEIAYSSVYLDEEKITFGGFVIRGRQKKQLLLPEFAKYCFMSKMIRKEMIRRGQGPIRVNIGQRDLLKIPIVIPTFEDQRLIASILDEWEILIDKTTNLINAKERQYEWLVTKLINKSGYKKKLISDFIEEVSIQNSDNRVDRVLSVTNHNGFMLPEELFERRVASIDVSNYKLVQRGQYAYNPSAIRTGSIARLDDWEVGIVSPMYIVFRIDCRVVNSDYFLHWLTSSEANQRINNSVQGIRNSVSLFDLGAIQISLPEIKIQRNISKYLNTSKQEINILKNLVEQYKILETNLRQKLLSGQFFEQHSVV